MLTKTELIDLFISKGILSFNNKRKHNWKFNFDDECKQQFAIYSEKYRSQDEAWYCLLKNIEPKTCKICGKLAKFTGSNKTGGYNTVCENCSANNVTDKKLKFNDTISKRTDVERKLINKKRKNTLLIKYGDENYNLFGSKSFYANIEDKYGNKYYNNRKKSEETCLKRYGVKYTFQDKEFIKKSILKKKEKYGNASNYEKTKQTNLIKYGKEHIGQVKAVQIKMSNIKHSNIKKIENANNCTNITTLIKKYGSGWLKLKLNKIKINGYAFIDNNDIPIIKKYHDEGYHTNNYVSNKEKELLSYIKSIYDGKIIENICNLVPNNNYRYYELDIYLPEINIAFEFNGTYWHSDKFKDMYYHQRKTKQCYEQGIQLINIYEYEWDNNELLKNDIYELLVNHKITHNNWIDINDYNKYKLNSPNKILINKYGKITEDKEQANFVIYDEGTFTKNEC